MNSVFIKIIIWNFNYIYSLIFFMFMKIHEIGAWSTMGNRLGISGTAISPSGLCSVSMIGLPGPSQDTAARGWAARATVLVMAIRAKSTSNLLLARNSLEAEKVVLAIGDAAAQVAGTARQRGAENDSRNTRQEKSMHIFFRSRFEDSERL